MRSDTAPSRLRGLVSWLIAQAALPTQRIVTEHLAQVSARRHHVAVLASLEEFGPHTQIALGRRTGIDRSDMTATVNELEAAGWLERRPDPADQRRNVVTITRRGRSQLTRLDRVLAAAQDELLAPLSTSQRRELLRLLAILVDHHASAEANRSRQAGSPRGTTDAASLP